MPSRIRTHARNNWVGYIALFFALGSGVGWAAQGLSKNSVGTKQLKNAAVTRAKLHKGAVNGSKVAANSLTGRQINSTTLGQVANSLHSLVADTAANAGHATSANSATTV